MVEKVFDGVCGAIAEEFELPVYTERIEQGLDGPCFLVRLESSVTERFFGERYLMKNRFKVTYLNPGRTEHLDSVKVVEGLCAALEAVNYGDGMVRGSDMKCTTGENTMEFWVSFNFFVWKYDEEEDTELMEELSIDESGIK